ncbi:MCE family protein [Antrihabitans cavernicola]|uniref:MCE family protein n=1 Tax=Antrihabitans cavernicola TaxID=2495913 RepID=A0A5A7S7Q8_9NOCA|nr:MCE family protein [Spelaeibacter cavernicola]KAA0021936.1 MCE family protein [Spelaeibacter cavernicola]
MTALTARRPSKKWLAIGALALVAILLAVGAFVYFSRLGKNTIVGNFVSTTGLYAGDDVRVLGVKVGKVDKVEPGGDSTKVTMSVDSNVHIPADAKAVIIAQSLVSARFVQLTPVYSGGPAMADDASIPVERTAVPVEWDDIKTELTKLSDALGPKGSDEQGSFGRLVNTAAANLDGNGTKLKDTLHQLSQTISILSDGRTDLFSTIRNLQVFVSALANSNEQIVQFGGRLASVSDVLATNSDELGTALNDLDTAVGDLKRFITDNGQALSESVGRLADATQVLAEKRPDLEKVLHVAPTALANFNNIYKPAQGTLTGAVALNNFGNPVNFLCGATEGLETNDSQKTADLCVQYLAPVLSTLAVNYPPILTNPATGVGAFPNQIRYSPPSLADSVPPQRADSMPVSSTPSVTVPGNLGALMLPGGGR